MRFKIGSVARVRKWKPKMGKERSDEANQAPFSRTFFKKVHGQVNIMEYIIMTLVIVVVVILLVVFLGGWQISQLKFEQSKSTSDRALMLLKQIENSPYFTKQPALFDDGKLEALSTMCDDLKPLFGEDWSATVKVLGGTDKWIVCPQQPDKLKKGYVLPTNIYRTKNTFGQSSLIPKTELGILEVSVYYAP